MWIPKCFCSVRSNNLIVFVFVFYITPTTLLVTLPQVVVKGRGNQYIQLVKVLYCKLLTIGKQLPTFPHRVKGLNYRPQRWEASVLPLRHRDPLMLILHDPREYKINTGWTDLRTGQYNGQLTSPALHCTFLSVRVSTPACPVCVFRHSEALISLCVTFCLIFDFEPQ